MMGFNKALRRQVRNVGVALFGLAAMEVYCQDDIPDLSLFRKSAQSQGINENFNGGITGWQLGKGFKLAGGEGVNGSPALFFERTIPGAEPGYATRIFPAPPSGNYHLSIKYRTEKLEIHKQLEEARGHLAGDRLPLGMIRFEGASSLNYTYVPIGRPTAGEWLEFSEDFIIPPDTKSLTIMLAMEHWKPVMTGHIWFDEILIESSVRSAFIYPVLPAALNIADAVGHIAIGAYSAIDITGPDVKMLIKAADKTKLASGSNGLFSAEFGDFQNGKVPVKATLLDMKGKRILAEYEYSLFRSKEKPGAGSSSFDSHRRITVDGKPFLPVGMVSWRPMSDADLRRCANAGFNFIYIEGLLGRRNLLVELPALLDGAQRCNLKVTVNLHNQISRNVESKNHLRSIMEFDGSKGMDNATMAIIDRFKDHPALLAWVVTDENPRDQLDEVRKLRELIASRDPSHLTSTVTDSTANFPYFISTADLFAIDSYPIHIIADQSLKGTNTSLKAVKAVDRHLPFLFVAQSFNWGAEGFGKPNARDTYLKERWPTDQETKAMPLLSLIHGTNAVAFFSYDAIWMKAEKVDPGIADRYWPSVVEAAKMLRGLEPFALTSMSDPQFKKDVVKGEVEARAIRSDAGKTAVLLVAIGPGDAQARITPPEGAKYHSKFGRSVQQDDGSWLFQATNIDCDILLSE